MHASDMPVSDMHVSGMHVSGMHVRDNMHVSRVQEHHLVGHHGVIMP